MNNILSINEALEEKYKLEESIPFSIRGDDNFLMSFKTEEDAIDIFQDYRKARELGECSPMALFNEHKCIDHTFDIDYLKNIPDEPIRVFIIDLVNGEVPCCLTVNKHDIESRRMKLSRKCFLHNYITSMSLISAEERGLPKILVDIVASKNKDLGPVEMNQPYVITDVLANMSDKPPMVIVVPDNESYLAADLHPGSDKISEIIDAQNRRLAEEMEKLKNDRFPL